MAEQAIGSPDRRPVAVLLDPMPESSRTILTERFEPEFEMRFAAGPDDARRLLPEADAVLTMWGSVDATMIACAPRCAVIQKLGVGIDKIDVTAAGQAGIVVLRAAGINADAVAELAMLLILTLSRQLPRAVAEVRSGVFDKESLRAASSQLVGRTVGLLGAGHIGREVARRARGFKLRVIYHDIVRASPELEEEMDAEYVSFHTLLTQSDILSLHVPSTPSTMGIIGRDALARMKPTSILINTSRGSLVDEDALAEAVREGRIAGAGLDVTSIEPLPRSSPLLDLENVVVTPHIGGAVGDNFPNVANRAFRNVSAIFAGHSVSPVDVVVYPDERRAAVKPLG